MSKFSVLRVEGLSSSGGSGDESDHGSKGTVRKKKGAAAQQRKKQPAGPVPAVRQKLHQQQHQQQQQQQETEWHRKDEELAESAYQRELAQAILASRLDVAAPTGVVGSGKAPSAASTAAASGSLQSMEAASERAASDTVRREKLAERERLRREIELDLQAKFQAVVAEKNAENAGLRAEADDLRRRLAVSEAEAQRVTSLLSLVEGKKARGLAEEIQQLTTVISELTEHSTDLDAQLAKERTRCHQLQEQLDRSCATRK